MKDNSSYYDIILDGAKIGVSKLEYSDVSMGVVFGKILFENVNSGYDFIKSYCVIKGIALKEDLPEDKFIITSAIPKLEVLNNQGIAIANQGINIEGMDSESFEIIITGIPFELLKGTFLT